VHRIDDDARQARRVEHALLEVEVPGAVLLRQQPSLQAIGQPRHVGVVRGAEGRVSELLGQGVNPVTGDYSRGAAGYWVEGGEIAFPVEEITIAGNLQQMFKQIAAIGSDVVVRSGRSTGSILVESMTIAGE
jgi:hypothetical protein